MESIHRKICVSKPPDARGHRLARPFCTGSGRTCDIEFQRFYPHEKRSKMKQINHDQSQRANHKVPSLALIPLVFELIFLGTWSKLPRTTAVQSPACGLQCRSNSSGACRTLSNRRTDRTIEPPGASASGQRNLKPATKAVTSSGFEVGALEILGSDEQHHEAWDMDDQMIRASAKTPIANQVHQVKRQAMA